MTKKVIVSGFLGGVVLMIWTFIVNGIFGLNSRIQMKTIPNERQVYEVLKENVTASGRYICNPELTTERRYPEGEPVYSVLYGGMGHEAAGSLMLIGLVVFLLTPTIAAWMLSKTTEETLSRYPRKVLFFTAIGLLFALFGDMTRYGIGDYPMRDSLILSLHNIVVWTVAGLVVAWRIKPAEKQ